MGLKVILTFFLLLSSLHFSIEKGCQRDPVIVMYLCESAVSYVPERYPLAS